MSERTDQVDVQEGVETMQEQAALDQEQGAAEVKASEADSSSTAGADVEEARKRVAEELDDEVAGVLENLAARAAEIESIESELEETKEQLMRQAASFQNYRRRTQQEMSRTVEQARVDVLRQLLDVVDDFDRTMGSIQQTEEQDEVDYEAAYRSLKEGVELVYRKLGDDLQRLDVEPIESVGQPFDEHEHEAVMQQPAPEGTEEGTVLQEVQRGYRMGDRILRHSKVIVAS